MVKYINIIKNKLTLTFNLFLKKVATSTTVLVDISFFNDDLKNALPFEWPSISITLLALSHKVMKINLRTSIQSPRVRPSKLKTTTTSRVVVD